MKKYCFFIMLVFGSSVVFGQTLKEINTLTTLQQYKKAKEGIDKFLADPKNAGTADAW